MCYNPYSLKGKTILVTGASSGIGRSVSIEASKLDANVILTARNNERLKESLDLMNQGCHSIFTCDLSDEKRIEELVSQLPVLDGLVCCAGINDKSLVKSLNKSKIDKMFNINVFGPIILVKELIKKKKLKTQASIVMISSISSNVATLSNALYASSKGALESFIRVAALELAPQRIRVNGIRPAVIETPILDSYPFKEELNEYKKSFPLQRFGRPEEIAYGVIYLLSDTTKWMTGTIFNIDGGITLR